ncbi:hypothetical protein [Enhygromyxa salina]|uniref:hypothetical protein n=1 Tax=Enhygromyxa salina TaxID=215803 RepID=UPI0015E76465|nr:hypothetical protein [Enhygromyxa salina]
MRTALSFAVLGVALWAAFAIDLGGHTFAEHVDTISDTPEAKQLIEGTRSTVNPALQEVRDRVLGEYVEAPTWIPTEPTLTRTNPGSAPASAPPPEPDFEPPLPGERRPKIPSIPSIPTIPTIPTVDVGPTVDDGVEPRLPGRR